jgi:ABC-type branched-subunit amino acid transport system substrate-binding protein
MPFDADHPTRRATLTTAARLAAGGMASGLLSACAAEMAGTEASPSASPTPAPTTQPGSTIGTGSVKVGLILPLSAPGAAGVAAISLRNAAELALSEFQNPDLTILVKDDKANADAARAAAQELIAGGVDLILGPIFAQAVRAVGEVARPAGKPVIAFSTDTTVASRSVYLLSFLPEDEVERVVGFAMAQGRKSFALLIPNTAYGSVVSAAFQQNVTKRGGRIVAIERTGSGRTELAVKNVAAVAAGANAQVDAIFAPDGAEGLAALSPLLQSAGVDPSRVKMLGTGVWNDNRVFGLPAFQGGWFAAPDSSGFNAFAGRYRAKFGSDPTRIATLSYDAVSLAAALVRTQGPKRFSEEVLTNAAGFNGADGVFRFKPGGTNDRGLAILEIRGNQAVDVSPAPKAFTA